jgi:hypothetical protein
MEFQEETTKGLAGFEPGALDLLEELRQSLEVFGRDCGEELLLVSEVPVRRPTR